jgi:hypothetical protein
LQHRLPVHGSTTVLLLALAPGLLTADLLLNDGHA